MSRAFIASVSLLMALALLTRPAPLRAQHSDSQQIGRAIDYFQSGKYHEAMLLLSVLDKKYSLTPRYRAYLGVCYYYEWQYDKCCALLDSVIPQLSAYAPHERAVYYYANAESHFQQGQYAQAIPYYEQMLTVCFENEKAANYYRLGLCHTFLRDYTSALSCLESALNYYERFQLPESSQRMAQIKHMIAGCKEKLGQRPSATPQPALPQPEAQPHEAPPLPPAPPPTK